MLLHDLVLLSYNELEYEEKRKYNFLEYENKNRFEK